MKLPFLLTAVALAAQVSSAAAQEIAIGVPVSLTGVYAFVGTAAVKGLEMAVEEINAGNEAGPGRKLKLVIADDGSNTNQTITLVNRLANVDKVLAIAGPSASPTVLAVSPVVNQLQIPMLGIAVTQAVNKAGPWSNRVINSPTTLMTALANYTNNAYKPKTIMTVASRDNDGAAAQSKVIRSVLEGKVQFAPEESAMMAETDFSALSTKIASTKPDVVMITMNDSAAANIILQSRQAGVPASQRFVANNAAASASFLRIGGKAVEGTLIGTDALPEIRTDALAKTFVANFQKKYNATPDQWNAVGYTIGKLYGHAIAAVKGPITRQAINDAVVATKDFPVVLGSGKTNFSFSAPDREPTYEPILITVKDGKFIPAP
jgi:branched-chain amino acid transport system substrate-binding protein